ncbi:MAG: pyridoxamine 5'-phosphate oxidase family protein [Clostridia bacterium]
MLKKEKQVTDLAEIADIIDNCEYCAIALIDGDKPYVIPMNFGYTLENGKLTLYFHCARFGKKLDLIKANANVAFEMSCNNKLFTAKLACHYGYAFKSIVGSGKASILTDMTEKQSALKIFMKKYSSTNFVIAENMANAVAIFKIDVEQFTGKYNKEIIRDKE